MKLMPGRGAEMPQQPGLHMGVGERLAQQRVVEQVDLPHRQVVGGAPPGVHARQSSAASSGAAAGLLSTSSIGSRSAMAGRRLQDRLADGCAVRSRGWRDRGAVPATHATSPAFARGCHKGILRYSQRAARARDSLVPDRKGRRRGMKNPDWEIPPNLQPDPDDYGYDLERALNGRGRPEDLRAAGRLHRRHAGHRARRQRRGDPRHGLVVDHRLSDHRGGDDLDHLGRRARGRRATRWLTTRKPGSGWCRRWGGSTCRRWRSAIRTG